MSWGKNLICTCWLRCRFIHKTIIYYILCNSHSIHIVAIMFNLMFLLLGWWLPNQWLWGEKKGEAKVCFIILFCFVMPGIETRPPKSKHAFDQKPYSWSRNSVSPLQLCEGGPILIFEKTIIIKKFNNYVQDHTASSWSGSRFCTCKHSPKLLFQLFGKTTGL